MARKRYSRQQIAKLFHKKCYFCEEEDYSILDAHRIIPGEKGGTYHPHNILVICSNCHRKVHSGGLQILGKHPSSTGRWVIHYMEDGKEHWK